MVINSRPINSKNRVYRRRECTVCHYRFATYELTAIDLARLEQDLERAKGLYEKCRKMCEKRCTET